MSFAWSQATLDLLFRLFIQEGRSAAESARLLGDGVTRNAVLGKVQRMGWTRQKPQIQTAVTAGQRPQSVTRPARRRPPFGRDVPLPPLRHVEVLSTPRPWMERGARECAYPVGDAVQPGGQLSCCAPTGGGTYCPAHRALMVLPDSCLTQKEQEAIAEIARRAA